MSIVATSRKADVCRPLPGGCYVWIDGGSVVHVIGEVDCLTVPTFAAALDWLITHTGEYVVDLSRLEYMSVAGVGVLVDAARSLGGRGRIVLRNPQPITRRLIDLTNLEQLVDVVITDPPPIRRANVRPVRL